LSSIQGYFGLSLGSECALALLRLLQKSGDRQATSPRPTKGMTRYTIQRISRTCRLVKSGACGPALRTGRPMIRSTRILPWHGRLLRGVSTAPPACTLASSESPGCRPSWRPIGPGCTTCPFVESLVSLVRVGPYLTRVEIRVAPRPQWAARAYEGFSSNLTTYCR